MATLTEDMKAMVAGLRLCYVATVTPEGKPNLSPKGSLKVLDDEHLAFADIMSPTTMRNLKTNPAIEVNMVDPFLRRGYRFKGTCEIHREGPVFDAVANELWVREGRQYPVNAVVRIKVEQALPVKSPAYVFNKGVQEEDVRRIWLERYGVAAK
ncbi:MAG TPA: pyridoxamine 5'-phosphate oxidase family protein [Burkholderiales bacterium]|nr:pyridoxamine 5'-phosphate oxidase family protein [Burkholderiales bacterium]